MRNVFERPAILLQRRVDPVARDAGEPRVERVQLVDDVARGLRVLLEVEREEALFGRFANSRWKLVVSRAAPCVGVERPVERL